MKMFIKKGLLISAFMLLGAISISFAGGEQNQDDWNKWKGDSPCGPVDMGNGKIICVAPVPHCREFCPEDIDVVKSILFAPMDESGDLSLSDIAAGK